MNKLFEQASAAAEVTDAPQEPNFFAQEEPPQNESREIDPDQKETAVYNKNIKGGSDNDAAHREENHL